MPLFDTHIVGPIRSRRLGLSLGVNLLPTDGKRCTFDCIYCECGWADPVHPGRLPEAEVVLSQLEDRLRRMSSDGQPPDSLTFAGNGEPTLHPNFPDIIRRTLALRDRYCPETRVSVLSNATRIDASDVRQALLSVDAAILKIDAGTDATARLIDRPAIGPRYSLLAVAHAMQAFRGQLTVQTLFLRGQHQGVTIDNTTPQEAEAWRQLILKIRPAAVMAYTIDRPTPVPTLTKVPRADIEAIVAPLRPYGIDVQVTA